MQKRLLKGLKPIIVKQLALLIGICYLVNPLHQQINKAFHELSHILETPDYIMSHGSITIEDESYGHNDDHFHIDALEHQHLIIDFIESLIAAADENDGSENSIVKQTKLDKHITTYQICLRSMFDLGVSHRFWLTHVRSGPGFLEMLTEPPQYSIDQSA